MQNKIRSFLLPWIYHIFSASLLKFIDIIDISVLPNPGWEKMVGSMLEMICVRIENRLGGCVKD